MHEVARNLAAFHQKQNKPGKMELVNPLVSTPVRGFAGIYIYIYGQVLYVASCLLPMSFCLLPLTPSRNEGDVEIIGIYFASPSGSLDITPAKAAACCTAMY